MYTFYLMCRDYLENSNIHFFALFFVFIFIRWGIIWGRAVRYRPYKCSSSDVDDLFSSVIIPVVDEPLDIFREVLNRISEQRPSEIIVVINGPKNQKLEDLCESLNFNLSDDMVPITYFHTPLAGKRNAIRMAVERVNPKSDIAILVDSDTIWTSNTLIELLKPFVVDNLVGGVTTRQKILSPERNIVTMFANLLEEIRAEGTMKAMSTTGKIGCLPGRTIAFRTQILREVMFEFMNETFMGLHKEVSDDRSLTNLTLKEGYKTVMQDTSVVYTDAPTRWKKFIRQQLRWAEGSQYNNLRMTPWMLKNAKLMFFIYWSDMLMPMVLVAMYINIILNKVLLMLGYTLTTLDYADEWWVVLLLIILGSMLSFGARNIKVFLHLRWYYFILSPLFVFVLTIIMVPIRIIGLMKCSDDMGWGTRNLGIDTNTNAIGTSDNHFLVSDDAKHIPFNKNLRLNNSQKLNRTDKTLPKISSTSDNHFFSGVGSVHKKKR